MKFRHLYWVTEQVGNDGHSQVTGVYTSMHDLVGRGLQWMDGIERKSSFRIYLVQVDSNRPPLGTWASPDFSGLEQDLQDYVKSDEFNSQEIEQFCSDLRAFF